MTNTLISILIVPVAVIAIVFIGAKMIDWYVRHK